MQKDDKFALNYNKTKSPNILIRIVSLIFYFKFHEIVFTNLCGVRPLRNKVEITRILYPINILLIISLLNSALLVVGASLISYSLQGSLLTSSTFIQSVDCIIVVVVNMIPTVLCLRRNEKEYTEDVEDEVKRYETNDEFHLN